MSACTEPACTSKETSCSAFTPGNSIDTRSKRRAAISETRNRRPETGNRFSSVPHALLLQHLPEILPRDEQAGGARVERRLDAILDPLLHHFAGLVAVALRREEHRAVEGGRFLF